MRAHLLLLGLVFFLIGLASPADKPSKKTAYWEGEKAFAKYVEVPGAERVGSKECLACHQEPAKAYHRSAHALAGVECEDCHGAGSLHAKGEDNYGKIIKAGARSAEAANGVCLGCHASAHELQNWFSGAHQSHEVRCLDCHRVHVAEPKLEARRLQNEACMRCHRKQEAESRLPYHHPVVEAKMGCADCHDPHGGTAGNNLRADNLNDLCLQCHAEFQGPFTYQHAPVQESCLKCHTSHGSMQSNLLQVSQPILCLQCHAGHHNGSGVPLTNRCTNCHSAIHGTDIPSATGGSVFIDKGSVHP
jgi:DmsE family decaheme c-type cytochrome